MIYDGKQLQCREWHPSSVCHLKEHSVVVSVILPLCLWSCKVVPWGELFEIYLCDSANLHLGSDLPK